MAITPRHVAMTAERYAMLTPEQRNSEWSMLIGKLGIEGAYLPVPFQDESRGIVGLNIVVLDEDDTE